MSGLAPDPASKDDRSRDPVAARDDGGVGTVTTRMPTSNAMRRNATPPSLLGEPGLRPETTDGTYSNALGNQALREPVKPDAFTTA